MKHIGSRLAFAPVHPRTNEGEKRDNVCVNARTTETKTSHDKVFPNHSILLAITVVVRSLEGYCPHIISQHYVHEIQDAMEALRVSESPFVSAALE